MNAKQKKFCEILVKRGLSATAAYKEVYSPKNDKTAQASASKLLSNDIVSEYIEHLQQKATDDTIMSRREVLQELSRLGRGNLKNVAKWDSGGLSLKDSDDLNEAESSTVQSIKETSNEYGGSVEIKQYDKIKPLELLAKHYGALDGGSENGDTGNGKSSVSRVLDTLRKIRK